MAETINEMVQEVHQGARSKGWWDDGERPFAEIIALAHTELSEALEEYRNGYHPAEIRYEPDGNGGAKPEGIPIELADVIIRIMDYCGWAGIDLDWALKEKIAFNRTRPHRHGGKAI